MYDNLSTGIFFWPPIFVPSAAWWVGNDNYGDYNDCLEDAADEVFHRLARDLALGGASSLQPAASPLQSIPGNSCGDGNDDDRCGGVGLFCKSGKNTFGNIGCVVGGARDNNNYGDCNDCLEDNVDEISC